MTPVGVPYTWQVGVRCRSTRVWEDLPPLCHRLQCGQRESPGEEMTPQESWRRKYILW